MLLEIIKNENNRSFEENPDAFLNLPPIENWIYEFSELNHHVDMSGNSLYTI